jgi:hypothetical protein
MAVLHLFNLNCHSSTAREQLSVFSDANTAAAAPTTMLATTSAVGGQTIRHANQPRTCHHRIVPNPDGQDLVLRKCSHLRCEITEDPLSLFQHLSIGLSEVGLLHSLPGLAGGLPSSVRGRWQGAFIADHLTTQIEDNVLLGDQGKRYRTSPPLLLQQSPRSRTRFSHACFAGRVMSGLRRFAARPRTAAR